MAQAPDMQALALRAAQQQLGQGQGAQQPAPGGVAPFLPGGVPSAGASQMGSGAAVGRVAVAGVAKDEHSVRT